MTIKTQLNKKLPSYVVEALNIFAENNINAYVVGGAVRDLVKGSTPKDYDIATEASPAVVSSIFLSEGYKVYETDRNTSFGRVSVMVKNNELEITTFRTDGDSSNNRHPDSCEFNVGMLEDSYRRDFTMNAMYLSLDGTLYDFHNGISHTKEGIVEFVGDPSERLEEDYLRILRFFRFCLKFDYFTYDNIGIIKRFANKLNLIAPERIKKEIEKIFEERKYNSIERLFGCGLVDSLFSSKLADSVRECTQITKYHPEVELVSHINLFYNNLIDQGITDSELYWVALLHDLGKPETETIEEDKEGNLRTRYFGHEHVSVKIAESFMKKYRFSNKESTKIAWLIEQHMRVSTVQKMKTKKLISLLRSPYIKDLCAIHSADDMIEEISPNSKYILDKLEEYKEKLEPIVTGKHLIAIGLKPSQEFSEILKKCEDIQFEQGLTSAVSILNKVVFKL